MAAVRFALRPDPEHPGYETIMADRGNGWYVVRGGRFTERENEQQIERLARNGITVERRKT